MINSHSHDRIDLLDGFRFFAILFIMLFHYYSRWNNADGTSLYPYGDSYNFFEYGYLGVICFFILSGFVIMYSLSNAKNIFQFWNKKLVRLIFPLIIASLLTFIIFTIFDNDYVMPWSHSLPNLLVSCTLISPDLINEIFGTNFAYINGSYWFLWVEIQFYIIVSILYFISSKNFLRNYTFLSLVFYLIYYVSSRVVANYLTTNKFGFDFSPFFIEKFESWSRIFNLLKFNNFFLLGVFLYSLYKKNISRFTIIMVTSVLVLLFILDTWFWTSYQMLIIGSIVLLYLIFIYFPKKLVWMSTVFITSIGKSSYFLFLIHESIGVLLIHKYATVFGNYSYLFPLLLIVSFMALSILSYKYVEQPFVLFCKKIQII